MMMLVGTKAWAVDTDGARLTKEKTDIGCYDPLFTEICNSNTYKVSDLCVLTYKVMSPSAPTVNNIVVTLTELNKNNLGCRIEFINPPSDFDPTTGKWNVGNVTQGTGFKTLELQIKFKDDITTLGGDISANATLVVNGGTSATLNAGDISIFDKPVVSRTGIYSSTIYSDENWTSPAEGQFTYVELIDTVESTSNFPYGKFTVTRNTSMRKWKIAGRSHIDWHFADDVIDTEVDLNDQNGLPDGDLYATSDTMRYTNEYKGASCNSITKDIIKTWVKKDYKPFVQLPTAQFDPCIQHNGQYDTLVFPRAATLELEITKDTLLSWNIPWVQDMQYQGTVDLTDPAKRDTVQLRDNSTYTIVDEETHTPPLALPTAKPIVFTPGPDYDTTMIALIPGTYKATYKYKYTYVRPARYPGSLCDSSMSLIVIYPHYLKAMDDTAHYHIYRTNKSPDGRTELAVQANDSTPYFNLGSPYIGGSALSRVRVVADVIVSGDTLSNLKKGKITINSDSTKIVFTPIADSAGVDSFRYILYYKGYENIKSSYDTAWAYVYIHNYALDFTHNIDTVRTTGELPKTEFGTQDTIVVDTLGQYVWNVLSVVNRDTRHTDSVFNIVVSDTLRGTQRWGASFGDTIVLKDSIKVYWVHHDTTHDGLQDTVVNDLLYYGLNGSGIDDAFNLSGTVQIIHWADSVFAIRLDTLMLREGKDTLKIYYQTQLRQTGVYPHQANVQLLRHPSISSSIPDTVLLHRVGEGATVGGGSARWDSAQYDTAWVKYQFYSKLKVTKTLDSIIYRPRTWNENKFSAADSGYFNGGSNDSLFLKGDTLVYLIKLERVDEFPFDSSQLVTDLVVLDTFYSRPYGRGIISIKTEPAGAVISPGDTIIKWTIRRLLRTQTADSLRVYVTLHDTTRYGDSISGKDYLFVGDTVRYSLRIDTCNEITPGSGYFAAVPDLTTASDTFRMLRYHPYVRTAPPYTYTVYPSQRTMDSIIIHPFEWDTIARFAKSKGHTVRLNLWRDGKVVQWDSNSTTIPPTVDSILVPNSNGKRVVYALFRSGDDTTALYSARHDSTFIGTDTFQYVVWYAPDKVNSGTPNYPANLIDYAKFPAGTIDTGWVYVHCAAWRALDVKHSIDTARVPAYFPAHTHDTITADSLRQTFWNQITIVNTGGTFATDIWITDTLAHQRDSIIFVDTSFRVYIHKKGISGLPVPNDNTVFAVDTATFNKRHLFTFDYHGASPPIANDTLNPGDTLRIYYRTQILKSGTYRSAPTVQMYYDRTGDGYDALDSLLRAANNAMYVSDTAYIHYDYHSKLKISKSLDSVRYRGTSVALSVDERAAAKFMKGDTLVYKIKLERASGGDSVQHTTDIWVWDTLINQHQPIGKKYGKFVKTVPSSAIRNDSVLNWNISVLPKGKKSDSLWVYVALNDNDSTTTAFSDSSVLQQKIKLVRSNETAVLKDSVFDTVRIFSLYDLRIKKLAGSRSNSSIINDTLYPASTNGDTVRYTLRVINKGRKSHISGLVISDTMQAGLRLLDTLMRQSSGEKVKLQGRTVSSFPASASADKDTIYTWTIDTVSIPIGDSVDFVYDAITKFLQVGDVLKNVAAINHSKLNGRPAVNAYPDLAVDSVKVDFRFDADSLDAVIFMQRGTLQSGKIVATTSRSDYYTAYDGDTIIMEVQVNNRYKKENRIATNVTVRARLDTAYMRFLSDHTGLQASQDSTIAAPLLKGESDTVYFYAFAKKPTTVGTTDSAYVWCDETMEINKRGTARNTHIGAGTKVNMDTVYFVEPTANGKYKQGAKIPYRIKLKQTAGYAPATNVVVCAVLPQQLTKAKVIRGTSAIPANELTPRGGDTLFVVEKFASNTADSTFTLFAAVDSAAQSIPLFMVYHDSLGYGKWRTDTIRTKLIDTVVPNPDNLKVTITPPTATGEPDWYDGQYLYTDTKCDYKVTVSISGTDTMPYRYTLTFELDPHLDSDSFSVSLRSGVQAVNNTFTTDFSFDNHTPHIYTIHGIKANSAGRYAIKANLEFIDATDDVFEKSLKDNQAVDTLRVVSLKDVEVRDQKIQVWRNNTFNDLNLDRGGDTLVEGDTVRLQVTVANLRSTVHNVTVQTSRIDSFIYVPNPPAKMLDNGDAHRQWMNKTIKWDNIVLVGKESLQLQAIFVADTFTTRSITKRWCAYLHNCEGDKNFANDTTRYDTVRVKRNPYDVSITKTALLSSLSIDASSKVVRYEIKLHNNRDSMLFAQVRDFIPTELRNSLQFDSVVDGNYRELIPDTAFVYPSKQPSASYPHILAVAVGTDRTIIVYGSIKAGASTLDFPFVNKASVAAFKDNGLIQKAKEATLNNNNDTAYFNLYDKYDLQTSFEVVRVVGANHPDENNILHQGDIIMLKANAKLGTNTSISNPDSLRLKITLTNGRSFLTEQKQYTSDTVFKTEWTNVAIANNVVDTVKFKVIKYHPDSMLHVAVEAIAYKVTETPLMATRNINRTYGFKPGAILTGSIQEIMDIPAKPPYNKTRTYKIKTYHEAASNYPAYNFNLVHNLPDASVKKDYRFVRKGWQAWDTTTFTVANDPQHRHIIVDTDNGFVFHCDTFPPTDTLDVIVGVYAAEPTSESENMAAYELIAEQRYAYNADDSTELRDNLMGYNKLRSGFFAYRNPYDMGVWILNKQLLDNLSNDEDFEGTTILDTMNYATAYTPHLVVQNSDTIRLVMHIHNLGGSYLGKSYNITNAQVLYKYDTTRLNLLLPIRTTPPTGQWQIPSGGMMSWDGIELASGQGVDAELTFVAKAKGLVMDTAWIDMKSIQPVEFRTEEDYLATFNNRAIDSILIFTDITQWVQGGKKNEIMTMFSPNGDGINDYFVIKELNDPAYSDNELIIFDRHGNTIFRQKPYGQQWDGAGLPDGVYFYRLNIQFNGKLQSPKIGTIEIRRIRR
ncbi:hypothetical protein FACS189452_02520 [Bacteroidia bacterium]|nr:hypothetical protein FACS189452_02520 [Bacteroidia bacterium]